MTTHVFEPGGHIAARRLRHAGEAMRWVVPFGRALYAAIFILASFSHFSSQTISYASDKGVPLAGLLVPLAGVMALVGGLSVLLGLEARAGAWLLVVFLVPVTLMMHAFWRESDAGARMLQQVMFLKNLGLLGGALLIAYFGAGPFSLDARRMAKKQRAP